MKFIASCWLIAVFLAGPAVAGNCRSVGRCDHVVVENVKVVKEVVVEKVVTPIVTAFVQPLYAAVFVPQVVAPVAGYGQGVAGYAGGYAPQGVAPVGAAPVATGQQGDPLLAAVRELTAELRSLKGGGQPPALGQTAPMQQADPPAQGAAPAPGGDRLFALASSRCASCHDAGRAQASGKGFVLTSGGKLATLTSEQLGLCISEISSGRMPKGGRMTAEERLEMVSLLVNGPAK